MRILFGLTFALMRKKDKKEKKFKYEGDPFTFTVRTLASTFENPDFFREPQE